MITASLLLNLTHATLALQRQVRELVRGARELIEKV
jgi:hypothetical protein